MTNSSILVGYEWRSIDGERFSAWEDGLVNTKVSDWENYEISKGSGRKIVHIYFIKDETGIHPYGKQTAMKKLGLTTSKNLDRVANRFHKEVEAKKIRQKLWLKEANSSIYMSKEEAVDSYMKSYEKVSALHGHRTMYPIDMKYLMTNGEKFFFVLRTDDEAIEALENHGWKKVSIGN